MEYALGALAGVTLLNTVLLVRMWRALGSVPRLDARVARIVDALALLTDTAESGFHALSEHLEGDRRPKPRARRTPAAERSATARMVRSSRRGRSAADIAASEEVAEGEVRLRLQLAAAGAPREALEQER